MERLKLAGKSQDEIDQAILEKKIASVEKYGNRSKVGLIIERDNVDLLKT